MERVMEMTPITLLEGDVPMELETPEGPLGSELGQLLFLTPLKCLREAGSGISWLMPGGGRAGLGRGWG